jgi:hypothetical protein
MDKLFKSLPTELQWEIMEKFVGTHVVRNGKLRRKLRHDQYFSPYKNLEYHNYFNNKTCLKQPLKKFDNMSRHSYPGRYLQGSLLDKAYIYGRETGSVVSAFVFINIGILVVFHNVFRDEISYGYYGGKTATVTLINGNYQKHPTWAIIKIPKLPEKYMRAYSISQEKLDQITNEEWDYNRRKGDKNYYNPDLMVKIMAERVQIERDMDEASFTIQLPELTLNELCYYAVQQYELPRYIKRSYESYPFTNKKLGRKSETMKLFWSPRRALSFGR